MDEPEAAEKECVPTKQVRNGKIKRAYVLDQTILRKHKEIYRLWKRYIEAKDAKVYQDYFQSAKSGSKKHKKSCQRSGEEYCITC